MSIMIPLSDFTIEKDKEIRTDWRNVTGEFFFRKFTSSVSYGSYWVFSSNIYIPDDGKYATLKEAVEAAKKLLSEENPQDFLFADFSLKKAFTTECFIHSAKHYPAMYKEKKSIAQITGSSGDWRINMQSKILGQKYWKKNQSRNSMLQAVHNLIEKNTPTLYFQTFDSPEEYYLYKNMITKAQCNMSFNKAWWMIFIKPEIDLAKLYS